MSTVSLPAGIDVSATPTHQEAVAVPYVAGEYVLPAHWISPSYDEHDVSVPASSSGKSSSKSSSSSSSTNWKRYATVAMIWHAGVADKLTGLILDEALLWSGNITRPADSDYTDIAIDSRGTYRHYWGTQTAPDPHLVAVGNNYNDDHPSYEGICYGILIDFLYGIDVEQAPSPRLRGERTPRQSFYTGTEAQNDDGQANPICVAAELLLDTRFGLSFPTAYCATDAWVVAIKEAYARRNLCFCSPVITDHQSARSFLEELFFTGDVYLRPAPETGLLECGFWTKPENVDAESLVTIEQVDLLDAHELTPGSWEDVKNTWNVTYRDRDYVMKENAVADFDQRALDIHEGETRNEDVTANPIVRAWQAKMLATDKKHRFGLPGIDGTLKVDAELVDGVYAGDHIRTDIDLRPGGVRLQQVFRVTRIKRTPKDVAELTLEAERTLAPISYNVTITEKAADPEADEIPEVGVSRFFELPWQNWAIGILAARTDGLLTGFHTHYDRTITGTYQTLSSDGGAGFALKARLVSAIPSDLDPAPVELELIGSFERELIATDPGDVGARDDQLLLILVKTTGGQISADADGLAYIEILSCQSFVVTGTNLVTATALRGRQSSIARPFAANTEAWLVRRADLPIFTHADFEDLAGANAYFKLQSIKLRDLRPLEDCTVRTFTFALARLETSDRLKYLERRYKRTVAQPDAPTVAEPTDWFVSMADAVGIGALWATEAYKYSDDDTLAGSWSVPVKVAEDSQVFEEFESQLTALQQDAADLAQAIADEAAARGTSISEVYTAIDNGDTAETNARTLALATLQTAIDGKATTAALETVRQTLVSADAAETIARENAISTLTDSLNSKASSASLTSVQQTLAAADSAETTARQAAISQVENELTGKASTSALSSVQTTLANADLAETTARQTAISQLENEISGKASLAAVQNEITTRATETTALASDITTIGSQVDDVSASVTLQAQTLATLAGDAEARYAINVVAGDGDSTVVTSIEFVSKAGSDPVSEIRFRADLLSEDFESGVNGWTINGDGTVEFNSGTFRGLLRTAKMATDCVAVNAAHPSIQLRRTSSSAATNSSVKLFGVGCKATDQTVADANRTYWAGEYTSRLATYNAMYNEYTAEGTGDGAYVDTYGFDGEGQWTVIGQHWEASLSSEHQAALDAQMVLVNAALTTATYWQLRYEGTLAAATELIGCSDTPTTFQATGIVGFSGTTGDGQLKYRINGGNWVTFGAYGTISGTNQNLILPFGVTVQVGLTDIIEFDIGWSDSNYAGRSIWVTWTNI